MGSGILGCMSRFGYLAVGLVVASVGGCYQRPAWPPCVLEVTQECWDSGSGGGSGGFGTETSGSIATVTTVDPTTSTATSDGSSDSSSSSGPAELEPPKIVGVTLMPNALMSAGLVTVEVAVKDASAVTMVVDGGEPVALTPVEDDGALFTGEIIVFGESWNGEHDVVAVATRDDEASEPWPEKFSVMAPAAGSEAWLEKSPLVPSYGNAVDVDDQGDVLELFTSPTPNGQECYVRRRNFKGESVWIGNARWIAQGEDCVGEDVKFAPDGTIWVLVNVYENGFGRWQLWHLDDDGMPLGQTPQVGSLTHMGHGLDVNADGDVLLCGTAPATQDDDDAWVRFQPLGDGSWTMPWDYISPNFPEKWEHKFSERAEDCAFVEDRIVVVGEAWGAHELNINKSQNRGFVVEFGLAAAKLAEVMNPSDLAWHSAHYAVAPDGLGGYVAAGYNCAAMVTPCNDTKGALRWFSLGAKEVDARTVASVRRVYDVALSPAGYNVVAAQALLIEKGFLVQGWSSGAFEPALEYQGLATKLQVATGITVDPVGFIMAGGYYQEMDDTLVAGVAKVNPH